MPRFPFTFTRRRAVAAAVVIVVGAAVWFFLSSGEDLVSQRQWSAQTSEPVGPLIYTPDGATLISGGADAVRLWNRRTGKLKLTLPTAGTLRLAVAPAGDVLGCARFHRAKGQPDQYTAEFWNLATGTRMAAIDAPVVGIAFSPAGPLAATTTGAAGAVVQLYALPAVAPAGTLPPLAYGAGGLAFSPDGKLLAVGQAGYVELYDVATLMPVRRFNGPAAAHFSRIAFTPDGKTIAGVCGITAPSTSSGVWTWDVATAGAKTQLDFGHPMHDCSFSADGKTLAVHLLWYVFSRSERIDLYDVARGRRTCSLSVRRPWMWSVALSPDAGQLAVGFQPLAYNVPATIGTWRVE
jgi:WD40 repeat protein